jgi:hypothetical protein
MSATHTQRVGKAATPPATPKPFTKKASADALATVEAMLTLESRRLESRIEALEKALKAKRQGARRGRVGKTARPA